MKIIKEKGLAVAKFFSACVVAASVIGCTSGNPYVETADRNDVITLGDSIFDLNGVIQETLEANAGETFRNYTQSGAKLSGGSLAASVESQYATANATNGAIDTIIMDGGGNDILIPAMFFDQYGCRTRWYRSNPAQACRNLLDDIYVTGVNLMNQMDADGVQNIVWLGYYELPRDNANLTKTLLLGDAKLDQACNTATTANCHYVQTLGTVPASQVESDDIHPTPAGSVNLAGQIWPVLEPLL